MILVLGVIVTLGGGRGPGCDVNEHFKITWP
jgi:hypothetical protein